jgi:hypothetical protein
MAGTGGSAPPIFAETVKFNGINWVTWKGLVKIAAELQGVYGYLDGSITNPTPPTPAPTTAAAPTTPPTPLMETPWESTIPSPSEWKVQNAWAMGLLIYI